MNAEHDTALKTVKVNRKRLIKKLNENMAIHEAEYEEAMKGYERERNNRVRALCVATVQCRDKPSDKTHEALNKAYHSYASLTAPVSSVGSYKKAISVMDWIESDMVKLSMNDFQCYVEDDWDWKRRFRRTVTSYASH